MTAAEAEDREAEVSAFLPPVSVLKPLHGTEDGLERNIETFFEQDYPEFELLFCARHEDDAGLKLARSVGARFPHVAARYVTCGEPTPQFHNAKDLALALSIEASELNEVFLWKSSEQADREKIKDELADVLTFALLLANEQKIDLGEIVLNKLKKSAEKYPVDKAKGSAKKYDQL